MESRGVNSSLARAAALLDRGHLSPDAVNQLRPGRMEPSRCAPFLGTHYYLLWVHFSREPEVILTMVLASRRHRIREWYLMGAVERLLSSQVLGFQAQLSQADSTRAREHEQSTDWLKKAVDERTAEIIHIKCEPILRKIGQNLVFRS